MLSQSTHSSVANSTASIDTALALSPIFGDLSDFPSTLVVTSTQDQLLSQSVIFPSRTAPRGRARRPLRVRSLPHAFWSCMLAPETDEVFEVMAVFFKKHLGADEVARAG